MAAIFSFLAGPFGPVLAQIAMAILGSLIGKNQENVRSRSRFLKLVEAMASEEVISVKLRDKYLEQAKTNAEKAAEQYKKENP